MQNFLSPLQVNHKKIMMLFTRVRAVVRQVDAACPGGRRALEFSAW